MIAFRSLQTKIQKCVQTALSDSNLRGISQAGGPSFCYFAFYLAHTSSNQVFSTPLVAVANMYNILRSTLNTIGRVANNVDESHTNQKRLTSNQERPLCGADL